MNLNDNTKTSPPCRVSSAGSRYPRKNNSAPIVRQHNIPKNPVHYANNISIIMSGTNNVNNSPIDRVAYKQTNVSLDDKLLSQKNKSILKTRNVSTTAANRIQADCIQHGYMIERTIGEGTYSTVKLAEVMSSKLATFPDMVGYADYDGKVKVAIKVIEMKNVPPEYLKNCLSLEVGHSSLPPHKNIVHVFDQFRTTDRCYVIMEYCSQGDLLHLLNHGDRDSCKGLGEDRAKNLFRMLGAGMQHIHANGIMHRDLKCQNVLLDKDGNIKITDFGFSRRFIPGQTNLTKTTCGSYGYTAPEVAMRKPYDGTKSDIWSMGILLYSMLNGRLPFNDAQLRDVNKYKLVQRIRFERSASSESMALVRRILQYNPDNRPTTADILKDPWLTAKGLIHGDTLNRTNTYKPSPPCQPKPPCQRRPCQLKQPCTPRPLFQPSPPCLPRPQYQRRPLFKPSPPSQLGTQYQLRPPYKSDCDRKELSVVVANTIMYKSTLPERGPDSTVIKNRERNEAVMPKRMAECKKNISRPRSGKLTGEQNQRSRDTSSSRVVSAGYTKSRIPVLVKPRKDNKTSGKEVPKACKAVSFNIQPSEKHMEKYMTHKEVSKDSKNLRHYQGLIDNEEDDIIQEYCRLTSIVKNKPTQAKPARSILVKPKSSAANEVTNNTNDVKKIVNHSVSPAERLQLTRKGLVIHYGNGELKKQHNGKNGLPHLVIQPVKLAPTHQAFNKHYILPKKIIDL